MNGINHDVPLNVTYFPLYTYPLTPKYIYIYARSLYCHILIYVAISRYEMFGSPTEHRKTQKVVVLKTQRLVSIFLRNVVFQFLDPT